MELIEVSTLEAVAIPCEIYEGAVDATISDAYCCDTSELYPENTRMEYQIIVKDPISSHIASINSKYDPDLLESALYEKFKTSKFSAEIGSTTMNYETCRLFKAQASEKCLGVSSNDGIHPRGVYYEKLSKIWKTDDTNGKRTLYATTQLNRRGLNKYL